MTFGALGRAFQVPECSAGVLIDEIDKADLDFPNDLLTVLDDPRAFSIREARLPPIRALHPPLVIITSNKEKGNLPAPFLRRCIYSYLEFPADPARLQEIIAAHGTAAAPRPAAETLEPALIDLAVERFLALRAQGNLFKPPGTSELLDWLRALGRAWGQRVGTADPAPIAALRDGTRLPFPELLFKQRVDWPRAAAGQAG